MKKPEISIVIVNYNVSALLKVCLQTLFAYNQQEDLFEVIVVDNNSADDSLQMLEKDFPKVKVLANKYNAGFPKANNQGFELAQGELIMMLNPDTEFYDNAIEKLAKEMEAQREWMLLAPKLLNTDRSRQLSVWRYPSLWSLFCETHYLNFLLKKKNYLDKNMTEPFEAESFSGAAILFRRQVLELIGNLDETLFWIEDVDFCYRANHKGLKCMYEPRIEIIHHVGQSAKKNYNISIMNQVVNKIKFARRHYSRWNHFLTSTMSVYHVILKLIIFGLLSPINVVYYRKFKAYVFTFPRVFNPPKGIT